MMQKIFLLFVLILTLACGTTQSIPKIPIEDATPSTINQIMNDWHKSAGNADYDGYLGRMDNAGSFYLGTDITENWDKQAFADFCKPYFDKGQGWSFDTIERNVYFSEHKNIAWFDEVLNTWMGVCRGSGVLEYKKGEWKLKQYVLSVAIPNDDVNKVIQTKAKTDASYLESKGAKLKF